MNDIIINKIQSIQRCIQRAREEYQFNKDGFLTDYSRQDAAILNLIRACEQSIDLANHIVKNYKMGIPTNTAETFQLLERKNVISAPLSENMGYMVGFRNTVVHEYQKINLNIVIAVIETGLDDLIKFTDSVTHNDTLNVKNTTLSAWVYDYKHTNGSMILLKGIWNRNGEQKRQYEFSSSSAGDVLMISESTTELYQKKKSSNLADIFIHKYLTI